MPAGILVVTLLLAAAAYFNGVAGEFVYDDAVQIVANENIQQAHHFWKAMLSDVWAFQSNRQAASSNYWRPLFNLWLILNYRLFGTEPAGWHVTSILLHGLVLVLAAAVLRRLGVVAVVSAAVLWIFSAHPVHVESVTWISGSPDLLLSVFLLASYLGLLAGRSAHRPVLGVVSWLLYAAALACKETAILFPAFVLASEWALGSADTAARRFRRALGAALPYASIAALWLVAHTFVLGMFSRSHRRGPSAAGAFLSIPEVLVFYLRQMFWPATLSPSYPLRPVEPGTVGLANFALPGIAVLLAAAVAYALWRRGSITKIGLALCLLFLAPALNLTAFPSENVVQDRYLYLPLLGLLLVVLNPLGELVRRGRSRQTERALYAGSLALAAVLALLTARYNRVWANNIALWERGVATDPHSLLTLSSLGHAYRVAGRNAEAHEMLQRAIEVRPDYPQAYVDLAFVAIAESRYGEAEQLLTRAIAVDSRHEAAHDQLAQLYVTEGRREEALKVLLQARERLPRLKIKNTMNIAILYAQMNQLAPALAELESIRDDLKGESDPGLLSCYYYLGELYLAAGRRDQARVAYQSYLERTERSTGAEAESLRTQAARRLAAL